MADFCITKVKYSSDGEHIQWLAVREEKETTVGPERIVERAFVAALIRRGLATFITRTWSQTKEKWVKGAEVHLVQENYLSTTKNDTKRDNLGNLPHINSTLLTG